MDPELRPAAAALHICVPTNTFPATPESPIKTVVQHGGPITDPGWVPESVTRAAGMPMIGTGKAPLRIGFGVGTGARHKLMSPTLAAGMPPISTVGAHGGMIGNPGGGAWGSAAGVAWGTAQMMPSPTRAAGNPDMVC